MATRVGVAKIWMTPFDRPTPKPPSLVQDSGTYVKCELSYGNFCVEISKFSFPWQQGWVWQISLTQLNWRTSKTRYLVQESWWYLLYKLSNDRLCVQMTSSCCHGNKGGSNGNLNNTIWLPDPKNSQVWRKHLARIFNGTRVMALRSCHCVMQIFKFGG